MMENNQFSNYVKLLWSEEEERGEVQTSIISYYKQESSSFSLPSLQVDLVSVLNIGDKEYYEALQTELKNYDCVLFGRLEMNGVNPLILCGYFINACLIMLLARILGLYQQKFLIDYEHSNWYQPDLDLKTILSLEHRQGECTLKRKLTREVWQIRGLISILPGLILRAMLNIRGFSKNKFRSAMKVKFAKKITSLRKTAKMDNTVLIGERNRAAMWALFEAISRGHKKIAIFYGFVNIADFDWRLRKELELVPQKERWITAWLISNQKPKSQ
ncbi:uncharacterized protein LOC143878670 [Tasmannia lanceolata]|uniref:uncharacterized protein LOC143878670 n=1 Tax=Tasmannia lanceolata TaxID=3420 RepID=UPI0040635386